MAEILVVDDDENMCMAFRQFLMEEGHHPTIASNAQDAVKAVSESRPNVVIMDIRMPGTDGLEALRRIREIQPNTYVILMTAYGTSQTSIEAVRLGAFDYLTKPFGLDEMKAAVNKALQAQRLGDEVHKQPVADWEKYPLVNLIGKHPEMQEVYRLIGHLTLHDVPALITGEKGVGKQLVASTIHFNSDRKHHTFLSLNCRTLPESALEAELFGREASERAAASPGALESSESGTLLLEEISSMSLPIQAKLLRFLSDRTFERIGASTRRTANTRILATADHDMADDIRLRRFDEELYDRLRLISIHIPPLRARASDIPELINHFVSRCNQELQTNTKGVDDPLMKALTTYSWPGNVGQLEHVIKRACILTRAEVLTLDDIGGSLEDAPIAGPDELNTALKLALRNMLHERLINGEPGAARSPFYDIVGNVEEILVHEALEMTGNNQVRAAEILGLNRTTFRKKMNLGET